jgi:hypothetical protein
MRSLCLGKSGKILSVSPLAVRNGGLRVPPLIFFSWNPAFGHGVFQAQGPAPHDPARNLGGRFFSEQGREQEDFSEIYSLSTPFYIIFSMRLSFDNHAKSKTHAGWQLLTSSFQAYVIV